MTWSSMPVQNPFIDRPDSAMASPIRISQPHPLNLPQITEVEMDRDYATTVSQLLNYIRVLEKNQVELVKMVETIVVELPKKIQQKVEKYMLHYQQNVVDKQIEEIYQQAARLHDEAESSLKKQRGMPEELNRRVMEAEKVYNQDSMDQLFEDIAQIRQALGRLLDVKIKSE